MLKVLLTKKQFILNLENMYNDVLGVGGARLEDELASVVARHVEVVEHGARASCDDAGRDHLSVHSHHEQQY